MRTNNLHHICNLSPIIIFRTVEDYLLAISRMASCAYMSYVDIFAFCILSTHFHIILRGDQNGVDNFIKLYKTNLIRLHRAFYHHSLKLIISDTPIVGDEHAITALNYTLKNPIHHGITNTAFSYPYSSMGCYFQNEIMKGERFPGERHIYKHKTPDELSSMDYRKLFCTHEVPNSFKIMNDQFLIPESFVAVNLVETIYSSARNFLFQMNKPLKEEEEAFDSKKGLLTGQISDLSACKIMDKYIAPKSYSDIRPEDKPELWNYLKTKGINYSQFQRMVR